MRWCDSPLRVTIVNNVELALSKGVPELDRSVSRSRNDLSVVGRERDRQDITSVTDKLSGGQTRVQVPKTKSLVPRGRQSELSIGRNGNVGYKVVVTVQDLLGETEVVVISGELPDDDRLV